MKATRGLLLLFTLAVVLAGTVYLLLPGGDTGDWETRKPLFQAAAVRAEPLILAINTYISDVGHPPAALADIIPAYLEKPPATGLRGCNRFEYRSLTDKQGSIVWYDLGSRQGQPYAGQSRYSDGNPDHAILVFNLDAKGDITSALIDRMPKGHKPEKFESVRWKDAENRIDMALSLSDTYRLYGMPRDVFEPLLGPPDGSRTVRGTAWELRINCPTGLLNHDTFVYWPVQKYPPHLYGGTTELIGKWAYVHS
ncbi:hypothetical protein MNBD_GAMMA14-1155 [hydrothermal vent metagenome]|uniref:Uncharacterized protein n=1 Tax=hydrothermal vent metagenome TaxID=652676 RepID=A0A3B0YQD6_9ZZZZ